MNTTDYKTLKLSMRSQLLGMAMIDEKYFMCVEALNFAEDVHVGMRKGGGHEFYHQLSILAELMNLHHFLIDPAFVYAAALLHDTYEDYPELEAEIRKKFPTVFEFVLRLSKIRNGVKIPYEQYFKEMAECHVCSVVKGGDRVHNLSSMIKPFAFNKQMDYMKEVDDYFQKMLKEARRLFPRQNTAYESIKSRLNLICITIKDTYEVAEYKKENPTLKGLNAS
jgi:(p)ppGpp synthase/HD superfamily hydrolase